MSIKKMTKKVNAKGFTLLEILLVVGIISILAGIVILAINPTKQLGDTRNAQRRSDVLTILNAVYQYSIDNNGEMPSMPVTDRDTACASTNHATSEIRRTASSDLTGSVNLFSSLVVSAASSTYLVAIPADPLRDAETQDTGYHIFRTSTGGRVTVCAPLSMGEGNIATGDLDAMIQVTR
jgi:type IV pilus assembly protein PilA